MLITKSVNLCIKTCVKSCGTDRRFQSSVWNFSHGVVPFLKWDNPNALHEYCGQSSGGFSAAFKINDMLYYGKYQISGLLKDNEKIHSSPEVPLSDDDLEIRKIKKVRCDHSDGVCRFKGGCVVFSAEIIEMQKGRRSQDGGIW